MKYLTINELTWIHFNKAFENKLCWLQDSNPHLPTNAMAASLISLSLVLAIIAFDLGWSLHGSRQPLL